ncbi:MAG: DUF3046 domain-containing protein [Candidatus Nanopelagicales bacterium]
MRYSTFWELLADRLGEVYAKSYAQDQVISELGLTVNQAFQTDIEPILVWRAICAQEGWPE